MFKIKELLCDIVKYTYGENCNPKYYKFYIEISSKNSKSCHGIYTYKSHKITIYNTYRDDEAIVCTTIHELAHHIDYCNRHTSDHQNPFYEEYQKLLYTAMDMGIVNKYKFFESTKDASDSNKIRKMMDNYIPNPIDYKKDIYTISVYNCYEHKDFLKRNGYHFNGNTKAWEKEVANAEEERLKIESIPGVKVEITNAKNLHFEGKIKLVIIAGDSYSIKDDLKTAGFKFENKKWVYYADTNEQVKHLKSMFPTLTMKIM